MRKNKTPGRCPWVPVRNALSVAYHDREWGVPVHNDRKLFEFLVLESAQAGLSWYLVLRKRESYRKAFAGFDPKKVAKFTARDRRRLLDDIGIIRNRAKIVSAINNAVCFLEVQKEFGSFSRYMWGFTGGRTIHHRLRTLKEYPAKTKEAEVWAKDLKARGFSFLGPVICYAHMQAVGMVNDHVLSCFRYRELKGRR